MFNFAIASFFLFFAQSGQTQKDGPVLQIINTETQIFVNSECEKSNTCDLKWVRITVKNWEIMINGEPNFGTTMIIDYETDSVENLENYGPVAFVRGCVFDARKLPDQTILKNISSAVRNFGIYRKYCYPLWTVEANFGDPFFTNSKMGRMYGWLWNTEYGSTDWKTEEYYGRQKPLTPHLYYKDTPGSAFVLGGVATNISLEFKICIYRAGDIPTEITEKDNLDFAVPIACFYWADSHIYNYETGIFEIRDEIDPFCGQCAETAKK